MFVCDFLFLSFAAENGHTDVVSLLLEKGAEVNGQDREGWTPIFWAGKYFIFIPTHISNAIPPIVFLSLPNQKMTLLCIAASRSLSK